MERVFLDANVILDFLDDNRALHEQTKSLFRALIDQNYLILISEDILTTLYYVVKDKPAVLNWFEYILDQWEIVSFGKHLISGAVEICKSHPALDFEDVLQSLSARQNGCSLIITNDKNFYNCGVSCLTTPDFLQKK